jgi:PAS domain S-box-containing protein/putative nucleotidyltransferase with HDIG domain
MSKQAGELENVSEGDLVLVHYNQVVPGRLQKQNQLDRRLEKALQQELGLAQQCLDIAGVMILALNDEGRISLINKKGCEILGYQEEEIIGRDWFEICLPSVNCGEVKNVFDRLKAGNHEALKYYENQVLTKTGLKRLIAFHNTLLRDQSGEVTGILCSGEDITERRQAETALRESEAQFRAIFDQAAVGVALVDSPTGGFLKINQKFCDILGLTPEETTGKNFMAIIHPDDLQSILDKMHKLQYGGVRYFSRETRFCQKDGVPVSVNLTVSAVQEMPEATKYYIAVVEDITQRQRAEIEVRQGLNKLRQALSGTVSALANTVEIKDPYTAGHQRRVAELACAIAQEIGLSRDHVEGMQVLSFLHDIGKIALPAEILSRPGKISTVEFNLIKSHPEVGYGILKDIEFPWPVAQAVLQHHERLDGSGYPAGLRGNAIIREAKILAVADVVEAMASHRPYRPSLGIEAALEEINKYKGNLFDSEAVGACLRLFREKGFSFS